MMTERQENLVRRVPAERGVVPTNCTMYWYHFFRIVTLDTNSK